MKAHVSHSAVATLRLVSRQGRHVVRPELANIERPRETTL